MSFTVLTHYSPDWQPCADINLPGREAYCQRHGYRHIVQVGPYHDALLYYAVDRLHLLLDLMKSEDSTEFYWVPNIPLVIMNHTIKLESFVDEAHDFFIHRDCNALNMGSFIIRASEWSRRWVTFLIEDVKTHTHVWRENKSVIDHAETDAWKDKVKVVPHPGFNSYLYSAGYNMPHETVGQWNPGDFVIALPGMDIGKRMGFLTSDWLQQSIIT